jgi:hypothetical protein
LQENKNPDSEVTDSPDISNEAPKEIRSEDSDSDIQSPKIVRARKNFWNRYLDAVDRYLTDMKLELETAAQTDSERKTAEEEFMKTKRSFDTVGIQV